MHQANSWGVDLSPGGGIRKRRTGGGECCLARQGELWDSALSLFCILLMLNLEEKGGRRPDLRRGGASDAIHFLAQEEAN